MKSRFKLCDIYYSSICLYFILMSLSHSMLGQGAVISPLINFGQHICVLCIIAKIFLEQSWRLKQFVFLVVGAVLGILIYLNMQSIVPISIIVTLLGAGNCSGRKIAKIFLASVGSVVVLSMLLAGAGIIEDRIFIRSSTGDIRHSFGMTYVTTWAAYIFFLLSVYIYLRFDNIKWFDYAILLAASVIVNYFTAARLESLMLILLAVGTMLYKKICKKRIVKAALIYSFPLSALVTFGLQGLYALGIEEVKYLDRFMTGRLSQTAIVLEQYGFTLFGQFIKMQGGGTVNFDEEIGYFFVDSFYINYTLRYGIIFLLAFCIFFVFLFRQLYKMQRQKILFFLFYACFHGILISSIMLPQLCPFFLIAYAEYTEGAAKPNLPGIMADGG